MYNPFICFLCFENMYIKKKLGLSYIVGASLVSYIRQDRPTVELMKEDLLSQKLCRTKKRNSFP